MQYILLIFVFALVQALLLGNICLYGLVMPLLYVYYAILFQRGYPRWAQMPLCFVMGILVDMFCNTPGLSAASMTLVGFIQPYVLELFLKKEDEPNLKPSFATMGFMSYFSYVLILTFIFCLTFFTLEAFSFSRWLDWVISVAGSTALTLILILTIDSVRRK